MHWPGQTGPDACADAGHDGSQIAKRLRSRWMSVHSIPSLIVDLMEAAL
jgi:hypothetical protein